MNAMNEAANTRNHIACMHQLHESTMQLVSSLLRNGKFSKSDKFQIAALPPLTDDFARACSVELRAYEPNLSLCKDNERRTTRMIMDLHTRTVAIISAHLRKEFDVTLVTYQIEIQALHDIALELCACVGVQAKTTA